MAESQQLEQQREYEEHQKNKWAEDEQQFIEQFEDLHTAGKGKEALLHLRNSAIDTAVNIIWSQLQGVTSEEQQRENYYNQEVQAILDTPELEYWHDKVDRLREDARAGNTSIRNVMVHLSKYVPAGKPSSPQRDDLADKRKRKANQANQRYMEEDTASPGASTRKEDDSDDLAERFITDWYGESKKAK